MIISSYGLSLILAIIACVIGGTLGGLTLARPGAMLGPPPEREPGSDAAAPAPAPPWAGSRALGAVLILSHATAALFLGYQSSVGAGMAFALAMAWLGAALGRALSVLVDKTGARLNLTSLLFEILIAVTLALPFFNPGRLVVHGHGILV